MAKCARCGEPLGLLSLSAHCADCKEFIRQGEIQEKARLLELERHRQQQVEIYTKNRAISAAKSIKSRIAAGETVYLHDSVYLPVDSKVVAETVCDEFSIDPICKMGIDGWEVVGVVPRTLGVGLTNSSFGASTGETWGAGVGGNVVGVHILLRLDTRTTSCSDRMLFEYALRHLEALAETGVE